MPQKTKDKRQRLRILSLLSVNGIRLIGTRENLTITDSFNYLGWRYLEK